MLIFFFFEFILVEERYLIFLRGNKNKYILHNILMVILSVHELIEI